MRAAEKIMSTIFCRRLLHVNLRKALGQRERQDSRGVCESASWCSDLSGFPLTQCRDSGNRDAEWTEVSSMICYLRLITPSTSPLARHGRVRNTTLTLKCQRFHKMTPSSQRTSPNNNPTQIRVTITDRVIDMVESI